MKDFGWIWEGQGLDPGVYPSIFGAGEGAKYFGLDRACFMFHPNDDLAMQKLGHLKEVVCDISKWKWRRTEDGGTAHRVDASPESVRWEAGNLSELSLRYPNLTGALHDDMKGLVTREDYAPSQYSEIYEALKEKNRDLKLWTVVYTHELEPDFWQGYLPYIDVVNLWVWRAEELPQLADNIPRCKEIFREKPIIIGCYLRDYPTRSPVPMNMLKIQWELVMEELEKKEIAGYSILGTVLIDGQQEQANWIRDFIARN
ncbi:MAG: hypothetical protein HXS50_00245 [Theionarchaea archaeon]|nr:hypothetical protein [Theionarchaea archaeon]